MVEKTRSEIEIEPDDPLVLPVLVAELVLQISEEPLVKRRDDELEVRELLGQQCSNRAPMVGVV